MPLIIAPAEKADVTRLVCPDCREKVRGVGLLPNSRIVGLVFRCRGCGAYKSVITE